MTGRTRTSTTTAPAKKTAAARKTTTRPARKTTAKKTTSRPVSLVKPPKPISLLKPLTARKPEFMTDTQGYATLAALIVGITTVRIRDWHDHLDGTATRRLRDGSHLHYNLPTRTLTWQAVCPMGAIHEYRLTSPSIAIAARVHADRCTQPHADLSKVKPLTADELEALGILQTPTWVRPDLIGDDFTETKVVPLPDRNPRALADTFAHSDSSTTETQPLSKTEIAAGLAARAADTETPKEHPEP
ncbi:hypothetical protein [Streptomyces sp. NBC_01483]|uniref:hypothetical protein n=1 Tax=Streptomyces sp. NBC_01483 TaxID=2903883 RepID=UPI002E3301C0|nr:hypothetical protein [Streptomyces sp. NBC_01483]